MTLLTVGAVALAGVVLVAALIGLARQPSAAGQRIALAPPSAVATPAASPPDQPTPFVAAPTSTPTATPSPTPTATPTSTSGGVTIVDPRLQARRGSRVTLVALAAARATCLIAVGTNPAPQLQPTTANAAGAVSWRWTVSTQVRPGTYPIQVTCGDSTAAGAITVS